MYPGNTTLTRNEELTIEIDGEDTPDPLNHIRVVAQSPVAKPTRPEWEGAFGDFVIITPIDVFGANETIPFSYLQEHYTVEDMPDNPTALRFDGPHPSEREFEHQLTPEQQFAKIAKEAANADV